MYNFSLFFIILIISIFSLKAQQSADYNLHVEILKGRKVILLINVEHTIVDTITSFPRLIKITDRFAASDQEISFIGLEFGMYSYFYFKKNENGLWLNFYSRTIGHLPQAGSSGWKTFKRKSFKITDIRRIVSTEIISKKKQIIEFDTSGNKYIDGKKAKKSANPFSH